MGPHASAGSGAEGSVRGFLRLVVIEHSVFALPFAYLAALTAMRTVGAQVRWGDLLLITMAMVAARTFAMATNRLVDRDLDARNPRTAQRELVTGALAPRVVWVGAIVAAAVFAVAAALLSSLCLALSPLALALLAVYPYTKRFTALCHAMLGVTQSVAPVGAWLAVTGGWSARAVLLGVAVGSWIGGFDVIYACQDIDSDRREGVRSLPSRAGARVALRVSTLVHVGTIGLLVWFGAAAGFGGLWYAGVVATALALAYEHAIVRPDDLHRVNRAFFTVNGYIAVGLFAFGLVDLLHRGLRA
ncbi:MAG: 4-hydroxybenzoate octaprenyltransferase [Frankia sp.]|nr:4-hydroxybenzoate octaprenyltransferase [Frankia sp.]